MTEDFIVFITQSDQNWITGPFSSYLSPPSSQCSHLFIASILLDLQLGSTHSSLNTIFFVVLAFFAENRLSLPTVATLFPVITLLSLGRQGILGLFVLCHFVGLVLATFLAERLAGFRNIHHVCLSSSSTESNIQIFLLVFWRQGFPLLSAGLEFAL